MVSFKTMETGEAELHVLDPSNGRTALVSTRPAMAYCWYVDETDGSLALLYWDFEWSRWRTPIRLSEDGSLIIGEEESLPWEYDKVRVGAPTLDNQGALYTIVPGVEDHDPRHLVVIENWVDSVITPAKTPAGS